MKPAHIAVIDVGKTNAKLALVETAGLTEIAVVTRPNTVLEGQPYPHFDVEMIWAFLLDALIAFQKQHRIDAISITTHGACGALIADDGSLAAPILDYECTGPDDVATAYDNLRPGFAETGSPRLPMGLNLGAQLHWQFHRDPDLRARTKAIVTYPQYWAYRLTGVVASDVSSLGCHTDLWNPHAAQFSSLVERLGIAGKIAPARKAADVLGPILPHLAVQTGLAADTPVHCGIHDSNASLLPHVLQRDPPFSVVSTGTWVIAMTVGGTANCLDPARDTLINVNAIGAPVPSARFMGGREFELIRGGQDTPVSDELLVEMAIDGPMLMPAVVPESGPFQGRQFQWVGEVPEPGSAMRTAVLSFYLALMTAECLSLTGHRGSIIVEGPFAVNPGFCGMLASAMDRPVFAANNATGTSQGAALLALEQGDLPQLDEPAKCKPINHAAFSKYAMRWRQAASQGQL
ncbi:MAG: FGGY-family carbohydrate kinase [Pseudomonadota bacterium]